MNNFTAVLDACVLYPFPLRDILVQMASDHLYRAKWTDEIHEEWISAVLSKNRHIQRTKLERTRELMNQAVLDSVVTGYQNLIDSVNLVDPNDRHVLAAAIRCNADAIVTRNHKDFSMSELAKYDIERIDPDDFLCQQIDLNVIGACSAFRKCRERWQRPNPPSVDDYLKVLDRQGLTNTVHRLITYRDAL